MKFDRLPLYLQEILNRRKKPQRVPKPIEETPSEDSDTDKKPTPVIDDEDKVTIINIKNDFALDYTLTENVHNKLKEIQDLRMKGKDNAKHHAELLAYILGFARDPRQKVEILLILLNSIFTSAKVAHVAGYLTRDAWVKSHGYIV